MTELERKRGEFEKWARDHTNLNLSRKGSYYVGESTGGVWAAWLSFQHSTLRRVRAALVANGEQQALAAIEREFGGAEKRRLPAPTGRTKAEEEG